MNAQPSPLSRSLTWMGGVYFFIFALSMWANQSGRFLKFPLLGQGFWKQMTQDTLLGIVLGGLCVGVFFVLDRWTRVFRPVSHFLGEIFQGLDLKGCFFIAAFSALGEEFFFRGLLQHYLGLVPSAALFAALHVAPYPGAWRWTLAAGVMGLALGGLYIWRENIWLVVVIHFVINMTNVVLLSRAKQSSAKTHPAEV